MRICVYICVYVCMYVCVCSMQRYKPYHIKRNCRICKASVHQVHAHYCQVCVCVCVCTFTFKSITIHAHTYTHAHTQREAKRARDPKRERQRDRYNERKCMNVYVCEHVWIFQIFTHTLVSVSFSHKLCKHTHNHSIHTTSFLRIVRIKREFARCADAKCWTRSSISREHRTKPCAVFVCECSLNYFWQIPNECIA